MNPTLPNRAGVYKGKEERGEYYQSMGPFDCRDIYA